MRCAAEGAVSSKIGRLAILVTTSISITTTMSFQSLRSFRDKKQAKSFVTVPTPSGTVSDNIPSDLSPPPPENQGFCYDLPPSMEMRVVPGKGRAIFSTVNSKPGFAPVRHRVSISFTDSQPKVTHYSIAGLMCWCCRLQTYQDTVLIAVRNS